MSRRSTCSAFRTKKSLSRPARIGWRRWVWHPCKYLMPCRDKMPSRLPASLKVIRIAFACGSTAHWIASKKSARPICLSAGEFFVSAILLKSRADYPIRRSRACVLWARMPWALALSCSRAAMCSDWATMWTPRWRAYSAIYRSVWTCMSLLTNPKSSVFHSPCSFAPCLKRSASSCWFPLSVLVGALVWWSPCRSRWYWRLPSSACQRRTSPCNACHSVPW